MKAVHMNFKVALPFLPDNSDEEKTIRTWILTDPILVYRYIYVPTKFNYTRLSVSKEAILLLKEELSKSHPEVLKRIEDRRKKRMRL